MINSGENSVLKGTWSPGNSLAELAVMCCSDETFVLGILQNYLLISKI